MAEGSHHECIRVGDRIVGHIRVTNSGKILSVWFKEPYNQLFLPESPDHRGEEEWVVTIAVFVLVVMACMMKIIWGKKNEDQQNLLDSNRIGTTIEEKTQSIQDSYEGIKKISRSKLRAFTEWFNNDYDSERIADEIWT